MPFAAGSGHPALQKKPARWFITRTSSKARAAGENVFASPRTMTRFKPALPHSALLELQRWNTPTIYNGWEQITRHNSARDAFNLEETRDFMPQMGPMVGYALTVTC